jgi:hypothetical protein
MPNYRENPRYEEAFKIANAKGYEFLIEYAAHEIDWQDTRKENTSAKFVVHHEKLNAEQTIVMEALKDMGEMLPQTGYYSKGFLPRATLENLILARKKAQAEKIRKDDHIYAVKVAKKAGYASLEDFAIGEVEWKENLSGPGKFIAYPEDVTPDARIVLNELKVEGKLEPTLGYHKNDYIPRPDLEQAIQQTHAAVVSAQRIIDSGLAQNL